MNKIRQYFSTFVLIRGFLFALLGTSFIYLNHYGFFYSLLNTLLAITSLYLLLQEDKKIWFAYGFFIGIFWFWWIGLSFKHYHMSWAIPFVTLFIGVAYGIIFWIIAKISDFTVGYCSSTTLKTNLVKWCCQETIPYMISLTLKATGLLILSYIHPFGFDWFKPELMFVESYLGIEKWQFSIILLAIILAIWKKQLFYLLLILPAYQPVAQTTQSNLKTIQIVTTHTVVEDKWNKSLHSKQFEKLFASIDKAIDNNKTLIILPESVFPVFINHSQTLIDKFQERAKHISIVTGGLYWDGKTPRNSTYIFTHGKVTVANKVVLVPFGESNPLPDFLSDWVNKIFYDGAVDYVASKNVIDYQIDNNIYRNAICFEATSEKLYEGHPKNMVVLSNNGWFTPSIEPTLQKLLLQYYSKKYSTTIYHSVNMSDSYVVQNGTIIKDFE